MKKLIPGIAVFLIVGSIALFNSQSIGLPLGQIFSNIPWCSAGLGQVCGKLQNGQDCKPGSKDKIECTWVQGSVCMDSSGQSLNCPVTAWGTATDGPCTCQCPEDTTYVPGPPALCVRAGVCGDGTRDINQYRYEECDEKEGTDAYDDDTDGCIGSECKLCAGIGAICSDTCWENDLGGEGGVGFECAGRAPDKFDGSDGRKILNCCSETTAYPPDGPDDGCVVPVHCEGPSWAVCGTKCEQIQAECQMPDDFCSYETGGDSGGTTGGPGGTIAGNTGGTNSGGPGGTTSGDTGGSNGDNGTDQSIGSTGSQSSQGSGGSSVSSTNSSNSFSFSVSSASSSRISSSAASSQSNSFSFSQSFSNSSGNSQNSQSNSNSFSFSTSFPSSGFSFSTSFPSSGFSFSNSFPSSGFSFSNSFSNSFSFSQSFSNSFSFSSSTGMCGNGIREGSEQCDNGSVCTGNYSLSCLTNADCRLCMLVGGVGRCGGSTTGRICTAHAQCANEQYFCAYDTFEDFTCDNSCRRIGSSSSRSSSFSFSQGFSNSFSFSQSFSNSFSFSQGFSNSSVGNSQSSSRSSSFSFSNSFSFSQSSCSTGNQCPSGICQNGVCIPLSSSAFSFSNSFSFSNPFSFSSLIAFSSPQSASFSFSQSSCSTGNQCPSGICQNGVCIPLSSSAFSQSSCSTGNQCPSGICVNGICAPISSSSFASVLVSLSQGSSTPTQCQIDSQCPANQVCINNLCVDGCNDASDCSTGICVAGSCYPCANNTECLANDVCSGGICVDVLPTAPIDDGLGCNNDSQCASGRCIQGSCTPCSSDTECSFGRCINNSCQIPTIVAAASVCGNGTLESPEECDDSNQRDSDGCTSTCLLEVGICGDGIVQKLLGEQCEPSKHNPQLSYACTACRFTSTLCGDGKLDAGEECDLGPSNSTSTDAPCRPDCSRSRCGDGIIDSAELCDDGNKADRDGCDRFCRTENGIPTQVASGFQNQNIAFPTQSTTQPIPFQLPLANLQPLIQSQGPVGDTGPAAVAALAAGAGAGIAFVRRKRRK